MFSILAIEGLMDDDDLLGHARANGKGDAKSTPSYKSCRMLLRYDLEKKTEGIVNGAFGPCSISTA